MDNQYNVDATVHMPIGGGGYRVKVSIHGLGFHINGMVVFPPNGEHKDWGVFTPQGQSKSGRFKQLEFAKKSQLWQEIYKACISAVKFYNGDDNFAPGLVDTDITDEELRKQVENLNF